MIDHLFTLREHWTAS